MWNLFYQKKKCEARGEGVCMGDELARLVIFYVKRKEVTIKKTFL